MRDGVELAADLYLPSERTPGPTLLLRTPYGRRTAEMEGYAHPFWYAVNGFAVVSQDVRGRGDSGGVFAPFLSEAADGYDTIEWIADQPWSNGRVGTYGFSYPGAVQLLAATLAPQHLTAMVPAMTASCFHEGWTYRGGALQLAFVLGWVAALGVDTALRAGDLDAAHRLEELLYKPDLLYSRLPVRDAFSPQLEQYLPYYRDWLDHPDFDDYWRRIAADQSVGAVTVPCLHIAGWYDTFLEGTVANFVRMQEQGTAEQRLVIGPWLHMPWTQYVGASDFGEAARNFIDEEQLRFFRRHLIDEPGTPDVANPPDPPVRVFLMGTDQWASFETWPPPARPMSLYLHSDGRANSLNGTGTLTEMEPLEDGPPDVIPADPRIPVRSLGGRSCCSEDLAPMGPVDQRPQESRNDVLVYTSVELEHSVTVVGAPRLELAFATDSPSADVFVHLTDVRPCGCSINVADGNVRLADASTSPTRIVLQLSPTGVVFERGHRIRLNIAGSNFPLTDRNPHTGTGGADARPDELRVATHFVFHDADRQSRLELPVIDP